MSGYAYPVGDIYVSSDYDDHSDRNPPSPEPGTDYAAAYGTPVVAAADGVVAYVKTTSSGGTGRYVAVNFDDGRADRDLHMSRCDVAAGQRVTRGQTVLGLSGASGYGSDWYYGSHVHKTLLPTPSSPLASSIDFELYIGEGTPPPSEDDDMAYTIYQNGGRILILGPETFLELGDALTKKTGVDGAETLATYQAIPGTRTVQLDPRQYDVLLVNTRASG